MNKQSGWGRRLSLLGGVLLVVTLSACASVRPGFEKPTVTVSSFRAVPGSGAVPKFEIGLHVINPNAEPLKLRGVAYTISLEGQNLIKGVANQLPVIEAYGEGDVLLTASANLLAGARMFSKLLSGPQDSVRWGLEAKLDVGALVPTIRIREAGEFSLSGLTATK